MDEVCSSWSMHEPEQPAQTTTNTTANQSMQVAIKAVGEALAGGAAPPACVTMAMGPSFFSVLGDR